MLIKPWSFQLCGPRGVSAGIPGVPGGSPLGIPGGPQGRWMGLKDPGPGPPLGPWGRPGALGSWQKKKEKTINWRKICDHMLKKGGISLNSRKIREIGWAKRPFEWGKPLNSRIIIIIISHGCKKTLLISRKIPKAQCAHLKKFSPTFFWKKEKKILNGIFLHNFLKYWDGDRPRRRKAATPLQTRA